MKVLHINCNYLTTVLHQTMVEHLDAEGAESTVFAPTYDASRAVIKPNSNVVVSECFKKWDRVWFGNKQRKIISSADSKLDVSDFDCIHAYTLYTDGNCAMKLSKKYGKPYVVAIRDTDVNFFFKLMPHLRPRGVKIMLGASKVFFLSTTYRDYVINKYVPKRKREEILKKSLIMPNGIDDFWFDNAYVERNTAESIERFANKQIKIVFAGRINNNKNPQTTLKAIDILEDKGYTCSFTVVGGVEDESLKTLLQNDKRVRYIAKCPKEELVNYYRESDIFVMPSFHETFGLVYAEAMSQGLPVLYTRGQGFDGQFADGEVGFAIDPNCPQNIVDKIIAVTENYSCISHNCTEQFRKFKWSDIVKQYAQIYDEINKE